MVGMTQQQLAEKVGIKFQQIQKYETGMNRVSASRLWDISEALSVPVSYFFEGMDRAEDAEAAAKPPRTARRHPVGQGSAGADPLLLRDPGKPAAPAVRACPRAFGHRRLRQMT
jgi:transcriptional regulator with XRE-family HTH domain